MNAAYSISRLQNWRGRHFDLANEVDWLDALDDFGPALIRFLADERSLRDVPDSDGALRALRRQVREQPIASFKPVRGSVWVLFAYKDGLRGLPPPFRTEGVLLPFVWTEKQKPPRGVPSALSALADQVKGQLGQGTTMWHLAPAACFGGRRVPNIGASLGGGSSTETTDGSARRGIWMRTDGRWMSFAIPDAIWKSPT